MKNIGKPLAANELKLFHQFFNDKFNGQMLSLGVISKCWHKYNGSTTNLMKHCV